MNVCRSMKFYHFLVFINFVMKSAKPAQEAKLNLFTNNRTSNTDFRKKKNLTLDLLANF